MPVELCVVTYNVWAPVAEPVRFTSQRERMQRIPQALFRAYPRADVVVVQESMVPALHAVLAAGMRERFPYCTESVRGRGKQVVDGGVFVFSRHPIVAQEQHVFGGGEGSDALSAKGWTYAKIDKVGNVFHVVATHLQAWPKPECCARRLEQCRMVRDFVAQRVCDKEAFLVIGDLNVDRYSSKRHLDELLDTLLVEYPDVDKDSHPFTADPNANMLVGLDDPEAYASHEYPNGCRDQHLDTLRCPCAPSEWLDYVTYRVDALQPLSCTMRCDPLESVEPFVCNLTMSVRRKTRMLSDHFPVVATLTFPGNPSARIPDLPPRPQKRMSPSILLLSGFLLVAILVTIAILVTLLLAGAA